MGGRGVSSTRFFLLEASLFIQDSEPPISAGIWAKGDGREAEESPRGLLFFLWLPINVLNRQAAAECHPSKDACRYTLMQNLMGLAHNQI